MITLSSLEPSALSSMLLAAVLGKLGKLGMKQTFPIKAQLGTILDIIIRTIRMD